MILPFRRRVFIRVFLIFFCCSAIAGARPAQFTSGVSLVEVYATVTDARGEPVTGLVADDFVVEEDGRAQKVQTFAAGDFPLSLAVAIDRSFSMSTERLAAVVRATERLLGELRPQDNVMVMAAGSEVEVLAPLSNDHRAAFEALRGLERWGTSPLFDTTLSALAAIDRAAGRRALLLITDGVDRYSRASEGEVLAEARKHDVLVYPVSLRSTPQPVLTELARVTGARATAVADLRTLPANLSAIADELRHQYLLGYVPTAEGPSRPGWRDIRVRVSRTGLRVRAREGYQAAR